MILLFTFIFTVCCGLALLLLWEQRSQWQRDEDVRTQTGDYPE